MQQLIHLTDIGYEVLTTTMKDDHDAYALIMYKRLVHDG